MTVRQQDADVIESEAPATRHRARTRALAQLDQRRAVRLCGKYYTGSLPRGNMNAQHP